MKELLKKKYLTEDLVREIKVSFFIHPSTEHEDGLFSFNYANHDNGEVIELFTSLAEYNEVYEDNKDYIPLYLYFNQFEHSFDTDTKGILINPASDAFFIPCWVCFLIMEDIDRINRIIKNTNCDVDVEDLKKLESKSSYLTKYLEGKSRITYITNLFDILSSSVVYVLYESENPLDGNDIILNEDTNLHFYKKDNYIVVFTDKNDFKGEMKLNLYYSYGICDLIDVIKTVFELDYNGFILKTQDSELPIERHRLLKYWDDIVERYRHIDIAGKYSFKIEDD